MKFSLKSQIAITWWGLIFATMYAVALIFFLHIVPPPRATMTSLEIQQWYLKHGHDIKIGALICGWCSAWFVPLSATVAAQIRRHEDGYPIWSQLTLISGGLTATFLVLPPIAFGAAAYNPLQSADATAALHKFGLLMLVTTDMWYVFMWVAIMVVAFRSNGVANTSFPRWFGYFTGFSMTVFEFGVFAFLARTGPFAWNGFIVWWAVFGIFFVWCYTAGYLLISAMKRQLAALDAGADLSADAVLV